MKNAASLMEFEGLLSRLQETANRPFLRHTDLVNILPHFHLHLGLQSDPFYPLAITKR
jgi:hypothetical protein